ncbi:MAG TPA: MMPL family transporter [Gaiellaceae bacterium]|nr:MMPL family transporter [Gaiellaceae bacterium]
MRRIPAFIAGRRTKLVVLAGWLVVLAALGPFIGKFEGAQENEPSSFLPEEAESVRVLEALGAFPDGDVTEAIVVFRSGDGLDEPDRQAIVRAREAVAAADIPGAGAPSPPVFAEDGAAALIAVPIRAGGEEDILTGAVDELRAVLDEQVPAVIETKVTGPAGFSADASKVFEGINSTLLFATAGLVFVLLVLIYRSPIFWLLPLVAVLFAESVVRGLGYLLAEAGVVINGQVGGILLVLVFGAGTDYALLLTARYREELRLLEDKHEAMRVALTQAGPAIVASAGTVVAALLCLSFASVNSTAGLGPIGAMGVAVAALTMLTLLPALLLVAGRRAFWPFVPRYGSEDASRQGFWRRLGERIEARPRPVWIATTLALAVIALGTLSLDDDLTTTNAFRGDVESVQGQELLARSFPAGASAPTVVLVSERSSVQTAVDAARSSDVVADVGRPQTGSPGTRFTVTLAADPYSENGYAAIETLRDEFRATVGDAALVGGPTAEEADLRAATQRDTRLLVPLVLAVVFAILVLLLRAITAPVLLMATVMLSYFAALGASLVLFELVADFPGEDPSYPLFAFIFLVALGVDYNIFLMARVREEAHHAPTREAMLTGLAVTGGVITSAGIVLAGTFSVLAVLPLVALTQIGITVALGVLLDTFIVRSILVPALTFEVGDRVWWPSRLRRRRRA